MGNAPNLREQPDAYELPPPKFDPALLEKLPPG